MPFAFEVIDHKSQDQAAGTIIAMVVGMVFSPDVGRPRSCPRPSRGSDANPSAAISLVEDEVLDEEPLEADDVLDLQRHSRKQ